MHLFLRPLRIIAPMAAMVLVTAACTGDDNGDDNGDGGGDGGGDAENGSDGDFPRDQVVIDIFFDGQESAIDPNRAAAPTDRAVFRPIYDTLVTHTSADLSEPEPWLATEWESNEGATEWTFHLREGVNFASGNPLTAEDVVWSLMRLKHIGDRASFIMDGLTPRVEDEHTVVIESEETNTAVPSILTSSNASIFDSELMEENGGVGDETAADADAAGDFLSENSAGSGPYVLERYDPDAEVVLTPNPEWWGTPPQIEQIVLRDADPSVQRLNIQSGEADVVTDLGSDEIATLDAEQFNIATSPGVNAWPLVFNLRPEVSEATSDPDFREAAKYAIDYDFLAEVAGPEASQLCGFILPSLAGALPSDDEACLEQDLERAQAALERSGVEEGDEVTFLLQEFDRDGVNAVDVGIRLQQIWEETLGIDVTVQEQPDSVVAEARNNGEIEAFIVPNSIRFPHPSAYVGTMVPGGGTSQSGTDYRGGWMPADDPNTPHDPVDGQDRCIELAAEATTTPDMSEAEPIYHEWERCMIEVSPFIPLVVGSAAVVTQPELAETVTEYHPLWFVDIPTMVGALPSE